MKSITKRIISTLFICGALVLEAGATAFSSIGKGLARETKAANVTGTFKKMDGDLVEGDYVLVTNFTASSTKYTRALANTVSSNKLNDYTPTITNDTIVDPDESIVWHIAPSGSSWTIYNAAVGKYVVGTGTKSQANLSTTSDNGLFTVTNKSNGQFEFSSNYNKGKSVNAIFRHNKGATGYWACYASDTAPTLYKKETGGGGGGDSYVTSSTFTNGGQYVLAADNTVSSKKTRYYFKDTTGSTYDDNASWGVCTDNIDEALVFTLTGTPSTSDASVAAKTTIGTADYYLAPLATGKFKLSSSTVNINLKTDGTLVNPSNTGYNLRYNHNGGSGGFRWYNGTTGTSGYFYPAPVVKKVESIAVNTAPTTVTYDEGQTFDPTGLKLDVTYNVGDDEVIAYADHQDDFSFDPDLTTPLTTGDTAVTITYGGKTVDQAITVNENLDPYIASVEITKSAINVKTHEDITASAEVTVENDPSSTLSKNVNWFQSSEDGGEVTFSKSTSASEEQIKISGKTAGTVTIQAKSAVTPIVLDSFTLTVGKNIVVSSVSIAGGDINKTSGYINDTQDLTATVSYQYDEGTNAVNWESSQPTVVSVDATGKIKFLANTTSAVTVTATSAENTEKSASISVTASNLEKKPALGGLEDGEKYFIIATYDEKEYYLKSFNSTEAVKDDAALWPGDDKAPAEDTDAWTFTATDTNDCWKITNNDGNTLYSIADNNGLRCGSSSHVWQVEDNEGLRVYNTSQSAKGKYLTLYQGSNWRTYGTIAGQSDENSIIRFVKYVAPVKPASLTLDIDEYTFTSISGTKKVTPTVLGPDSAVVTADYEIDWSTSDGDVATVEPNTDGSGEITPKATGPATITATIDGKYTESGSNLTASVSVTVRTFGFSDDVPSVIGIEETLDLSTHLAVDPTFSGSETYVWTSSKDTKLSVDEDGVVTGIAETEEPVTIKVVVTDENGYKYTDSVEIEVASGIIEPVRVELSSNVSNLTLGGDSDKIKAVVFGEDDKPATAQDISISGSYSEVVDVDEEENVITISPKAVGETTIIVNFVGGDETKAQKIAVKVDYAALTSIELSADTTEIFGDGKVEITATPNEHASLDGVEFTVTPAIATVTHKEGNVYTLTANDKYVGGTVSVSASYGNVTSNALSIDIVDYLNYIGKKSIIPASEETISFENLGASLSGTANTTVQTMDITAKDTDDVYTFNYLQCKKQGSAAFLVKSVNAFIANSTAMPQNIKSVTVHINNGASGSTTYYCGFFTSAKSEADSGETTAVNITGGNSYTFECKVENAKYFCISLGNANNGQVLSLDVTYEIPQSEGPEVNISNTNITVQKQVVEYAHWLNENYSTGIELLDWEDISAEYSEVLGSLEGENLELAQYMFKHAIASTGIDTDCLQNCVSLYDAAAKKYNLVDSSNNFMGRTLEASTYAYSYDVGEGTATGGSDAGNYVYSSEITLPSVSYEGYKFGGWYTDFGFTTPLVNTDGKFNMPANAVTAYAKWVALETYDVELSSESKFVTSLTDVDGNEVTSIQEGQDLELVVHQLDDETVLPDSITVKIDGVTLSEYFYGDISDVRTIIIDSQYITGDVSITIVATHNQITVKPDLDGLNVNITLPQSVDYGATVSGTLTPTDDNRTLPENITVSGIDPDLVSYNSTTGEFSFTANAESEITITATAGYINAPINQDELNENDLYVDEESIPTGVDAEIKLKTDDTTLDLSTANISVIGVEKFEYDPESHIISIEGQYVVGPIKISGFALPKTVNINHSSIDTDVISYSDMTEGASGIPPYLGTEFNATILPQTGYKDVELTITMNNVTLEDTDYSYNPESGALVINEITGDIVINATASLILQEYTITIQKDDNIAVTADKETVMAGDSVTFTVKVTTDYYHIGSVTYTIGGGEEKTAELDANNQFAIEKVNGNIVVTPKSEIDSYSVKYNHDTNSSATGAETVAHGGDLEVTVTAITAHYHIDTVTYTVNGGEAKIATLDKDGKFTITGVDGAVVINVTSAIDTYAVSVTDDNNVKVTLNTTSPVAYGTNVTFTVTVDAGYNATVEYKVGEGEWEVPALNVNNQFTLKVTDTIQVRAVSTAIDYEIVVPEDDNYVVTAKPETVNYDSSSLIEILVHDGYHVTSLGYKIGDGSFVDITEDVVLVDGFYSFEIKNIKNDVEITLEVAINTYTVTPTPDTNSYINVDSSVAHGDDLVVEVGASEHYHLVSISYTIAGDDKAYSVDPADLVEGKFTIEDVTGDVAISVTSAKDTVSVNTVLNDSTAQYDITSVEYDGTYSNTFTGKTGYDVVSVTYQIGEDAPVTVSGKTLTINNVTAALVITVNTEEVTVESIAVIPTEVVLENGQDINPSSLVVTATYSNGSSKPVTNFTITGYNKDVAGEYNATVEYTEGDITVSCNLKVTVKAAVVLDSISVDPESISIDYGATIDTSLLTVTATYSDESTVVVTDFVLGEYDSHKVGTQVVTISYRGKTCELTVVVNDRVIDHIEVVEGSYTDSVYQGDAYTFNGSINVYYQDGGEPVEVTEGFEVSTLDTSTVGDKTLTVTYGGKTAEVTIHVVAKPVQPTVTELVVTDFTNKIEVGGTYTFDGIVVAKYSDGTQETLEASQYTVSALDTSTEGEKTVTITFGDKTKDITVTVYKPDQPTPAPQDPPMSTGAKVGIGVGAAAGSIGLAVGLFFLIKLFKLKK